MPNVLFKISEKVNEWLWFVKSGNPGTTRQRAANKIMEKEIPATFDWKKHKRNRLRRKAAGQKTRAEK